MKKLILKPKLLKGLVLKRFKIPKKSKGSKYA
jgi:hypothetical protein